MAARDFVREVVKSLVLLDRPAKRRSSLHPRVSRIGNRAERIHRLKIPVAQISVDVAVKIIRSGAGDDIHHAARRSAILRRVTVGDDLELLHRFLRNGGANAVGGIVGGVGAVHVHQVRTGALAAHVQPGSRRRSNAGSVVAQHLRIGEGEVDVVAAVDRKIVDAALVDGVGRRRALRFDQLGGRTDIDDFLGSRHRQADGNFRHRANGNRHVGHGGLGETRSGHGHRVGTRRQQQDAVLAVSVLAGVALQAFALVPRRDRGVGHHAALGIPDRNMQIAGSDSLGKAEGGEQNQLNRDCDQLPQHHKSFLRRRGRGPRAVKRPPTLRGQDWTNTFLAGKCRTVFTSERAGGIKLNY